jgi:DNA-binding transcriptional ArsR family regulator
VSEIIFKKTSILKILADPSRYKILELLISSDGKLCVGDIALKSNNSHSAVSHQLAKLESAGLIRPTRNGQQICYLLENNEQVDIVLKIMKTLSTKNLYSKN